jgi:hypothetical protein
MASKITCTCGHSWDKLDSSKKDATVCHICGKNNMKDGGWLEKYAEGGRMQEHQENYNDNTTLLPPGFVGMGNNTKGRNYSPAWGGQFEDGGSIPQAQKGWLEKLQRKVEESVGHPMNRGVDYSRDAVKNKKAQEEDTLRHAYSAMETNKAIQDKTGNIPFISSGLGFLGANALGVGHELIHLFNSTSDEVRESGEDVINNFTGSLAGSIPFVSDENKRKAIQYLSDKGILPDGTTAGMGRKYDVISKNKKYAMGGSLPGSVGFTYARTNSPAPSNGPYAKKTKASAENGTEMSYYQHGLDWKPKSISRDGSDIPKNQNAKTAVSANKENDLQKLQTWAKENNIKTSSAKVKSEEERNKEKAQAITNAVKQGKVSQASNIRTDEKVNQNVRNLNQKIRQEADQDEKEKQKRIAERQSAKAFNEGKSKTFTLPSGETKSLDQMDWRDKAYVAGKSLEGKGRLFENDESIVDTFNPVNWFTEMGGALGEAPYQARESDSYLPYLTSIGAPLLLGATGAIGGESSKIGTGLKDIGKSSSLWTKELIQGSKEAGKLKLPKFVTALRTEAAGFNPSAVAPHPSLNPTQQTFTGNWVQAASKENPAAFDEMLAYISGPERKAGGDLQLLSDVIPWSKAEKIAGKNLPFDAKTMSFGAGKYGSLENALKEGAISNREFTLLKNYNTQGSRIAGSPNLNQAMEQTVSRLRAHPELYNPNEMLSPTLANTLRSAPLAVGSSELIASEIQGLKNAALRNRYISDQVLQGSKNVAKGLSEETGLHNIVGSLHESDENTESPKLKKGDKVINSDLGQWAHPGEITKINSNRITMKGVPYPVLGISNKGDRKMMYPEQEYTFKGNTVTEYPQKKKGGWLENYN